MSDSLLHLAPDPARGTKLGRYEVLCRLSTGGMSEIFLAYQKGVAGFRKLVVLKQILPDIKDDENFVRMFLNEAKLSAAFTHPNIAQVYDLDIDGHALFLAMEFVPGATLVEVARACRESNQRIPVGFTLSAIRDTALALHYAHAYTTPTGAQQPVIHRDVAEKNIMVTYEGTTKLLDFGVAKSVRPSWRTAVGVLKGSAGYMSPEQLRGETLDPRSDIFSLGVVLHELFTGVRLFYAEKLEDELVAPMKVQPIPPSKKNPDVGPGLDRVVLRALEKDRARRFATGLEMARAIEEAAEGGLWRPEQMGGFMQQLFAKRREQTRRLFEASDIPEGTGEIHLEDLLGEFASSPTPARGQRGRGSGSSAPVAPSGATPTPTTSGGVKAAGGAGRTPTRSALPAASASSGTAGGPGPGSARDGLTTAVIRTQAAAAAAANAPSPADTDEASVSALPRSEDVNLAEGADPLEGLELDDEVLRGRPERLRRSSTRPDALPAQPLPPVHPPWADEIATGPGKRAAQGLRSFEETPDSSSPLLDASEEHTALALRPSAVADEPRILVNEERQFAPSFVDAPVTRITRGGKNALQPVGKPDEAPDEDDDAPARPATGRRVLAGLLAVAAVGLGVLAFSPEARQWAAPKAGGLAAAAVDRFPALAPHHAALLARFPTLAVPGPAAPDAPVEAATVPGPTPRPGVSPEALADDGDPATVPTGAQPRSAGAGYPEATAAALLADGGLAVAALAPEALGTAPGASADGGLSATGLGTLLLEQAVGPSRDGGATGEGRDKPGGGAHALGARLTESGARGAQKGYTPAKLSLKTVPSSVRVYLGERLLGTTPLRAVSLPPGTHALRLESGPKERRRLQVRLAPGGRSQLEVKLRLLPRD